MRILFAGTPDFAATPLQALLDAGIQPVGVFTQPDKPSGRGRQWMPPPVKQVALAAGLPVYQPETLKTPQMTQQIQALQPDLLIVVAYGQILPQAILDIPTHGCWNIHASLLPKWRGAAPIQRAIEAGDAHTGVALMQMDAGLDTGAVIIDKALPIQAQHTSATLHQDLASLGCEALLDGIRRLQALRDETAPFQGQYLPSRVQDHDAASYARKLSKAEANLDWHQCAQRLQQQTQAFDPWPVAWSTLHLNNQAPITCKLRQAAVRPSQGTADVGQLLAVEDHHLWVRTGDGDIGFQRLQLAGKKAMSAADFANGVQPFARQAQFVLAPLTQ